MLLFVTSNRALAVDHRDACRLDPRGHPAWRAPTPRRSSTARSLRNDAGRSTAVGFTATTKATLTLLAYDGTAADPVAAFASAAETVNRAAHTTPGATVATAGSYVVSYWADKSARPPRAGPFPRARPSAASPRAPAPGGSPRSLRPQRAVSAAPAAGRTATARSRPPRRRCGPSCSSPTDGTPTSPRSPASP